VQGISNEKKRNSEAVSNCIVHCDKTVNKMVKNFYSQDAMKEYTNTKVAGMNKQFSDLQADITSKVYHV
jgi:hypothetical protein